MRLTIKILLLLFVLVLVSSRVVIAQENLPVLAFYYAWFDENTWSSSQSVDTPAQPYTSADPATIERHVTQAKGAGINALVQSWYGPQEENNQTETNFRMLLDQSLAQGLQAAVSFETSSPFFGGDSSAITSALSTLLASHGQHPAYLHYQGKPVVFFWRQQQLPVETWQSIRNEVDPNHSAYWIAEGVDIDYQDVFDGQYLYSVAWADSPAAQLAKWGDRVRAYEAANGVDRLWIATSMPGYDDTQLPRDDAFSVPRRNGDYYRETWQGALASQPDMMIITSFNEWPEGTAIEPGVDYGNFYLDLTRELASSLNGNSPVAPQADVAALQAAQETPPDSEEGAQENPPDEGNAGEEGQDTPPETEGDAQEAPAETEEAQAPPIDGPYFTVEAVTNVRGGPGTGFDSVGRLPADSAVRVVGRLENSSWWQIDFEGAPNRKGWVSASVVEFFGDSSSVPVVEAPTAPNSAVVETTKAVVTVPTGGVNVRSGPGLNFETLGKLAEGTDYAVAAKDSSGEWWQIEYAAGEDGLAWVAVSVVDFNGNEAGVSIVTGPSAPTATPEPVVVGSIEATDAINVRNAPSVDGDILGGLYLGESADVLSVSEDGQWWQIEFGAPEEEAWVASEFVRFTGDKNNVPIFGLGTATPTPGPTDTPAANSTPTPLVIADGKPTVAPSATSVYDATSAAMLAERGTPDPSLSEESASPRTSSFSWASIPWGILSILVIGGFLWYQFIYRRGKRKR